MASKEDRRVFGISPRGVESTTRASFFVPGWGYQQQQARLRGAG